MKLIHLSDLHLGKRFNEFSMIEDQKYILTEILHIMEAEHPDAVLIAGDVYDKSVPSAEAVEVFDDFLVRLSQKNLQVFVISGNHDSPERLAFGNRLINASGVHLSPVYDGKVEPVVLEDEYGKVNIYMLPFIKPVLVKRFFPEEEITSYTDAAKAAVRQMKILSEERNILVAHQFVTGATLSDSEDLSVGGLDNMDGAVFAAFDYVALGHIHGPQNIGSEKIRYCGTPLKYSFSEEAHEKSVTIVELKEKGVMELRTVSLHPLHDVHSIKGTFQEITDPEFYRETTYPNDYIHITLTDEDDIMEAYSRLRKTYPYLMSINYDNKRTREKSHVTGAEDVENKTPYELFAEFFKSQNGEEMSEEQSSFMKQLIEEIMEDKE